MENLIEFLNNIYTKIKNKFYHIKNFLQWLPIIYNDSQFDHFYLFKILEFKLNLMEKYFKIYGISINSKKDSRRIQICKNLCKRIKDDDYFKNIWEDHYKKWGDIKISHTNKYCNIYHENCKTEKDFYNEISEHKILNKREEYLRNQDLDLLFKTMRKYVLHWWD